MQTLSNTYLTETQFAQIVGRMRLYQALPQGLSRYIPRLLITDSQINNVCRGYYGNPDFAAGKGIPDEEAWDELDKELNQKEKYEMAEAVWE